IASAGTKLHAIQRLPVRGGATGNDGIVATCRRTEDVAFAVGGRSDVEGTIEGGGSPRFEVNSCLPFMRPELRPVVGKAHQGHGAKAKASARAAHRVNAASIGNTISHRLEAAASEIDAFRPTGCPFRRKSSDASFIDRRAA